LELSSLRAGAAIQQFIYFTIKKILPIFQYHRENLFNGNTFLRGGRGLLKKLLKKIDLCFILPFCLGDFNTLNPKDYTKDEWSNIVKQRIENGRQPPCHRVIQVNIK